jgi:hypothetical protein
MFYLIKMQIFIKNKAQVVTNLSDTKRHGFIPRADFDVIRVTSINFVDNFRLLEISTVIEHSRDSYLDHAINF